MKKNQAPPVLHVSRSGFTALNSNVIAIHPSVFSASASHLNRFIETKGQFNKTRQWITTVDKQLLNSYRKVLCNTAKATPIKPCSGTHY